MKHHDINIKVLLFHVLAGWLIASQMTLLHIRISDIDGEHGFILGMLGAIGGCYMGFVAYNKRWFLKKDDELK